MGMRTMPGKNLALSLTCFICSLLGGAAPAAAEDVVEFLAGSKVVGTVKEIRKDKKEFDIEVRIGTRTYLRTYPFSKVHAVTMKGKRFVLNTIPDSSSSSGGAGAAASGSSRSKMEIDDLINDVGRRSPDWYDSTALDYPRTLDLSWPLKPPKKGWNNQVNIGQYLWDIIYPNTPRWKSGIRLIHHEMSLHANDRTLLGRDMRTLGSMYFNLFQDYPRAAFWFRKAGTQPGSLDSVLLAECYWRLGNKQMANELLSSRTLPAQAIKLLGDMGETRRALDLANAYAKAGRPHEAYLLAGDACRVAGQTDQAIKFYEQVVAAKGARNKDYEKRYVGRAKDSIEAIRLFDQADVSRVQDGSFTGDALGYNGMIQVKVDVAGGRIQSVKVTNHKEKQFYSALTDTPNQILKKQTVKGIDATSRATITSQSIVNATAKALAKGSQ
jgi:uncharacterized protein with FMN-binding domain